jgi:hypothetical protein
VDPVTPSAPQRRSYAPAEEKATPRDSAGTVEAVEEFRLAIAPGAATAPMRQAVNQVLETWGLSHPADDALYVTTEFVQNVSRHTAGGGELRIALCEDIILIEVTDTDPQPPVLHERDPRRVGGRGLIIVAALARRWGHRPAPGVGQHGKVVWAEVELHPPTCPC